MAAPLLSLIAYRIILHHAGKQECCKNFDKGKWAITGQNKKSRAYFWWEG